MANYTQNLNLKKPLWEDYYEVDDLNGNADIIDGAIGSIRFNLRYIDGGSFTDDPVEIHTATAFSHANMVVEGGSLELVDGSSVTNLEEHLADEYAHPNIILDGNIEK